MRVEKLRWSEVGDGESSVPPSRRRLNRDATTTAHFTSREIFLVDGRGEDIGQLSRAG